MKEKKLPFIDSPIEKMYFLSGWMDIPIGKDNSFEKKSRLLKIFHTWKWMDFLLIVLALSSLDGI